MSTTERSEPDCSGRGRRVVLVALRFRHADEVLNADGMTALRASTMRPSQPRFSRQSVMLLPVLASAAVGIVLTVQVKLGVALLVALCYVPLALTNLGVGLAVWVALPFLAGISAFDLGGKAAGVLVAVAWFGLLAQRRSVISRAIAVNRVAFAGLAALVVWVTLSMAWASDPAAAAKDLWHWYAVGLIFVIIVTTIESRRLMQLVVFAFVAGAVLSVAYGLAGGITPSEAANPLVYSSRLGGAFGDPNFLAAGVVCAVVLAAALMASIRDVPYGLRILVVSGFIAAFAVLVAGLVATQSRGGLVACLVAALLAVPLFPDQRRWVLSIVLILVAAGAVAIALSPSTLQRVSSAGNGSGRTDEWTIALRMLRDHTLTGVGDANYQVVARDYTRLPGTLTDAQYLVDQPHVVHNVYLQFLSETGIVGLALFVTIAGACLRAGWRAASRFKALGDSAMETLSRGVVLALIAMLTASAFISSEVDQRVWVLLALGPAMLAVAVGQPYVNSLGRSPSTSPSGGDRTPTASWV